MNTREVEQLSQSWSEQELASALRSFILAVGRLPDAGELTRYLSRRRCTPQKPIASSEPEDSRQPRHGSPRTCPGSGSTHRTADDLRRVARREMERDRGAGSL